MKPLAMKASTEFVGTFLFFFVIALVAPSGSVLTPIAIGLALAAAVYANGHRSGAHYNPAISWALFLQKKITATELGAYVIAQLLGGILAFTVGTGIVGKPVRIAPGEGIADLSAFLVEAIFTFFLTLVVMNVAATKKTEGNSFYGLAIGFTIVGAAIAGGPISGGAFNPAVGLSAAIAKGNLPQVWIYIAGPLLGSTLGSLFFALQESSDEAPSPSPSDVAREETRL